MQWEKELRVFPRGKFFETLKVTGRRGYYRWLCGHAAASSVLFALAAEFSPSTCHLGQVDFLVLDLPVTVHQRGYVIAPVMVILNG